MMSGSPHRACVVVSHFTAIVLCDLIETLPQSDIPLPILVKGRHGELLGRGWLILIRQPYSMKIMVLAQPAGLGINTDKGADDGIGNISGLAGIRSKLRQGERAGDIGPNVGANEGQPRSMVGP